jgi:hypothetical protein
MNEITKATIGFKSIQEDNKRTKRSSICVIYQILPICRTIKLKFCSTSFSKKTTKSKKMQSKTKKTRKNNFKNLSTLKCEMQMQGLEGKNTTL